MKNENHDGLVNSTNEYSPIDLEVQDFQDPPVKGESQDISARNKVSQYLS